MKGKWLDFKLIKGIWLSLLVLLLLSSTVLAADSSGSYQTGDGIEYTGKTITGSENEDATNYFYRQLNNRERKFYHALETMAGVQSCDRKDQSHTGKSNKNDPDKDKQFYRGENLILTTSGKPYELTQQDFNVGKNQLIQDMGAARDAFQYDHPEVFYIDWSLISLRVFTENGQTQATLGTGREDHYYLQGFKSGDDNLPEEINLSEGATEKEVTVAWAVKDFENKLEAAVNEITENELVKNKDSDPNIKRLKAVAAHDYVTKHMMYHYEHEVNGFGGNVRYSNARTAYDALTFHEGVCESYTRLYKALMDRLGVPTICVHGAYLDDDRSEEHIWNYVQLPDSINEGSDVCFMVDTTMDDPLRTDNIYRYDGLAGSTEQVSGGGGQWEKVAFPSKKNIPIVDLAKNEEKLCDEIDGTYGNNRNLRDGKLYPFVNSGKENRSLCLLGSSRILSTHAASAFLSSANRAFGYPSLILDGTGEVAATEQNGFKIKVIPSTVEGEAADVFYPTYLVSYDGKNYTENAKEGRYIIMRYGEKNKEGEMEYTDWTYPGVEERAIYNQTEFLEPKEPDKDLGHYLKFDYPQVQWMQFAITDLPPNFVDEYPIYMQDQKNYSWEKIKNWWFYQGDPKNLTIISQGVENAYNLYTAPPYVIKSSPDQNGTLNCSVDEPYRISITYDDILVKKSGDEGVTKVNEALGEVDNNFVIKLTKQKMGSKIIEPVDKAKSHISNIKLETVAENDNSTFGGTNADGTQGTGSKGIKYVSKVSFDFYPDKDFASHNAIYNFKPELVGKKSGKEPNSIGYYFGYPVNCCSILAAQNGWDVFGYPRLLDPSMFNTNPSDYVGQNGESNNLTLSDNSTLQQLGINEDNFNKITHRLQLVVNKPTNNQYDDNGTEDQLDSGLENKLETAIKQQDNEVQDDSVVASYYNIALSLCKKMVIKTGQRVRVCVGFPEGTSYEDFKGGTTFKAYHYKPEGGGYKLEEINCEVTPLGLIIECDSFSPFAIAKVNLTTEAQEQENNKRTISFITEGQGGIYDGETKQIEPVSIDNISSYQSDATIKNYTITPNTDYVIDEVRINNIPKKLSDLNNVNDNKGSKSLEIKKSDFQNGKALVIEASFVPANIKNEEDLKKGNSEIPITTSLNVTAKSGESIGPVSVQEGSRVVLTAEIGEGTILNPDGVITYTWYKDNKVVQTDTSNQLIIDSLSNKQVGNYKVKATYNLFGKEISSDFSNSISVSIKTKSQADITVNTQDGKGTVKAYNRTENGITEVNPTGNTAIITNVEEGTKIRISAIPKDNYKFAGWKKNNDVDLISKDPETTIIADGHSTTYTAQFTELKPITVTAEVSGVGDGTVLIDGESNSSKSVKPGTAVTLKAEPSSNKNILFKEWTVDNKHVSDDPEYIVAPTKDTTYKAVFEPKKSVSVNLETNSTEAGDVKETSKGDYTKGSKITASATPKLGYEFVEWIKETKAGDKTQESVVSNSHELIYEITQEDMDNESVTFKAIFKGKPVEVVVSSQGNGTVHTSVPKEIEGKPVTEQGTTITTEVGKTITLEATPNSGYKLKSWSLNGKNIGTVNSYTISANDLDEKIKTEPIKDPENKEGTEIYLLKFEAEFENSSSPSPSPGPSNPNPPQPSTPDTPNTPEPDQVVVEMQEPTKEEAKLPEGVEVVEPEEFTIDVTGADSEITENNHDATIASGKKIIKINYDKAKYSFIKWLVTFVKNVSKQDIQANIMAVNPVYEYPSETLTLDINEDVILKPVFIAKKDSATLKMNVDPEKSATIKYKDEDFGTDETPFSTSVNVVKGDTLVLTAQKSDSFNGTFSGWTISGSGLETTAKDQTEIKITVSKNASNINATAKFEETQKQIETTELYRLYHPITGEHLFTTSALERNTLIQGGWTDEGTAWKAPNDGEPVYRLYNPILNHHLYTKDKNEVNVLTTQHGWVSDFNGNALFYSGGNVPVYRLYNEGLNGMHLLTTDRNEFEVLPQYGWSQEGISLKAVSIK